MRKFLVSMLMLTIVFTCTCRLSRAEAEYNLSLNLPIPPIHNRWNNALKPWMDELSKRSNGRITVEPYFAEAISKQSEAMDSVKNGLADFAESAFSTSVGQFPYYERVFDIMDAGRSLQESNKILHEMEKSFPQLAQETKGVKVLFTHALPVGMLIGTKEPVTTLDDLKGKKIAVIGGATAAESVKALGASVVNIPMSDIYMALQQGIIDGSMADFQLLTARRYGDLLKHMMLVPVNGGVFYVCMNEDVYNSMPDDLKKVIDDMSGEYAQKMFEDFWKKDQLASLEKWQKDMGGQLHVLTDAEYEEINNRRKPAEKIWLEMVGKSGLPAQEMLDRYRELEKQYDPRWKESDLAKYFNK